MAWTYADWRSQPTDAARLSRLRSHMDEVEAKIDAAVSDGGASRSTDTLETKLARLTEEETKLLARLKSSGGGIGYMRRR